MNTKQTGSLVLSIMTLVLIASVFYVWPKYRVWQRELAGRAQLAEAEWNRKIEIQEAEAKFESSKHLAKAEVERAKGVAEANKIIGQSLKNNQAYLRWLWINNMDNEKEVIYIPTEAGLPILEAGKRAVNGR